MTSARSSLCCPPSARTCSSAPPSRPTSGASREGILRDPAFVQVTPRNTAPDLVAQIVHPVDRERKRELLSKLVLDRRIDQALVFTRTKHGADRLAEQLERDGIAAAAIHGNKSQPQRIRALDDFKRGRVLILVATDIAARGIDIDALPHVVNYELPMVPEDYVHRIGRTGRAGTDGTAVSLVCVDEHRLLRDIEDAAGPPHPARSRCRLRARPATAPRADPAAPADGRTNGSATRPGCASPTRARPPPQCLAGAGPRILAPARVVVPASTPAAALPPANHPASSRGRRHRSAPASAPDRWARARRVDARPGSRIAPRGAVRGAMAHPSIATATRGTATSGTTVSATRQGGGVRRDAGAALPGERFGDRPSR